ncbi:glycosyltransferase family 39 protein [Polymorphobacter sp. PAMC 29334]|uniref:ArnT family glycosyltransferase n=1 Tax=Polymorphobacter sp. PAMC 29334 TaxID=2862331 RepID=UPI001C753A2E|nr:glycosyltransferase family 39 protein [Polymorphobacter sp. PAMC 29334]QYE34624.1 glycosyltransferase family 39 protein [Polymorphobacter sp. PAMC 29334]
MPPTLAPTDRRAGLSRVATVVVLVAFAVAVAIFQLLDLGWAPLQAWDESRLAVNAYEMMHSGRHFVTTYGYRPDLWNTKPPLAINLMAWSMELLGPTPFAARLPAALAACATVALVVFAVRRITGALGCGIAAGTLLAAAPSFYGYHAGQTGDYDAILTLFTTAYGFALFDLIERDRPAAGLALGAGVLVGLAILTKGIAGIIPGVGIAVYALVFGFRTLPRKIADYAIVAATAGVIGGVFYWLRGSAGDGYLAAVALNELGGRFETALDQHAGSKWFYVRELTIYFPGKLWPAIIASPLLAAGPPRRLAIFALCQIACVLIVYSSAATKIAWYLVPAMPFVATAIALAGLGLVHGAQRFPPAVRTGVQIALAAVVVLCAVDAVRHRYTKQFIPATPPRDFGTLINAASDRKMVPLIVVDTGFANDAGMTHYAPTLRFYALAAAQAGVTVSQATDFDRLGGARSFGSCDPAVRDHVAEYGRVVWSGAGCILAER